MKKKIILGIVLMMSLLIVTVVASVAPTLAVQQTNQIKFTGALAEITIQIPSNSSPPAIPGGIPDHPTTLKIAAFDWDKRSTNGAADELLIQIWSPVGVVLSPGGNFQPVAVITDNPANAALWDSYWNGTYVSYHVGPPRFPPNSNLFPNVIQVEPQDLEVWTTSSWTDGNGRWDMDEYGRTVWTTSSDTLWINLTKSIKVTLPYFSIGRYPNGSAINSNQTFTLPPMTMMFKATSDPFDESFKIELKWYPGASGYTLIRTGSSTFAGARVKIPNWIGAKDSDTYEETGLVYWRVTDTLTPP